MKINVKYLFIILVSSIFINGCGGSGDTPNVSPDNTNNGLVAYYPFNGNANDESGNNNNGIVTGAILVSDKNGNVNSAYSFNGIDNYIESTQNIGISGDNARTACAWVKPTQTFPTSCCPTPFSWGEPVTGRGFGNFVSSGSWFFWGFLDDFNTNIAVHTDWSFQCVTYDSTTVKYYIDGSEVGNQIKNLNTTDSHLVIGDGFDHRSGTLLDTQFDGFIDEVSIYNRALSQSEIQNLFSK